MGVKSGSFTSRDGRTYVVKFSGESVIDGELLLGVPPVVLSMSSSERKFVGFKTTTATINVLTDEPLVDLYSATTTGIKLEVLEGSTVIFLGYVTPFAFDQTSSGEYDNFSVQAVDMMSVRKDVHYRNVGDVHGVDVSAIGILQAICSRAGITRIVQHLTHLESRGGDISVSHLNAMVAQAGFLQDENSEVDALSAICQFFGYTAHVVGDTLYLYDEYCLSVATSAMVYEAPKVGNMWMSYTEDLTPQDIRETEICNDISVSIERAYDGIKISPKGSDTSILLPDVCKEENVQPDDYGVYPSYRVIDGTTYRRRARVSRYLETGKATESGVGVEPFVGDAYLDSEPIIGNLTDDDWRVGSVLVEMETSKIKKAGPVMTGNDFSNSFYLWIRDGLFTFHSTKETFVHRESTRYSHTGGRIKLMCKACIAHPEDDNPSIIPINQKPETLMNGPLQVTVGDQYLNAVGHTTNEGYYLTAETSPEKEIGCQFYAGDIVPTWNQWLDIDGFELVFGELPPGQVCLKHWPNPEFTEPYNWLITSLSIEAVGTEHEPFEHNYRDLGEQLTAESLLTTRGNSARPGVVLGESFNGYYAVDNGWQIDTYGLMQRQLVGRYREPHVAYSMTVRSRVNPFSAVVVRGQSYTVEAYDWDIYDDSTTITID